MERQADNHCGVVAEIGASGVFESRDARDKGKRPKSRERPRAQEISAAVERSSKKMSGEA